MARDVPTIDDSCDNCGASEADDVLVFDFMGDHLCGECADSPSDDEDSSEETGILMEKITVNPIEPRYFLRAIAGPDKDIENQDFQILIQVGDEFYNACPNTIRLDVESSSKVVMDMEVDLHDMIIDMPARLVNQKGGVSKARVRIVGEHEHSGQHALNSASDIEKVTADGEEIYAGSFILEADGETNGNNLTVHTLLPPSKDT